MHELVDALGRNLHDLRISVTDRCNFNCTYCMPEEPLAFLPRSEILSFEAIIRVTRVLANLGARKIKLTGGEPTLRIGLHSLISMLTTVEKIEDIALITNGAFLKTLSPRLYNAGLRRLTVSLDALDERIFQSIVGNTHAVHPILEGIDLAAATGFFPIKINCVMQRGINDTEILPLAEYFRQRGMALRFIEFMDVGDIEWDNARVIPSAEILSRLREVYDLEEVEPAYRGEVARRYRYRDGGAEIGFITSVTAPFCADCNRIRLSSDGKLFGCLFTHTGLDIKPFLRDNVSDDELGGIISSFWKTRADRYSELRGLKQQGLPQNKVSAKHPMYFIGG